MGFGSMSPVLWNNQSLVAEKSPNSTARASSRTEYSSGQLAMIAKDFGSGSFLIARSVPAPMTTSRSEALLAFSPVDVQIAVPHADLTISLSSLTGSSGLTGSSAMFDSSGAVPTKTQFAVSHADKKIRPGSYRVQLISSSPVWYAPNTYYERRSLPTPPEGSIQRYLKGALGNHAIFLDSSLAVHSAMEWSEDVGGIQVSNEVFEHLLSHLDVGDVVEILP